MNTDHFRSTFADNLEKASLKEQECPITMGGHGCSGAYLLRL